MNKSNEVLLDEALDICSILIGVVKNREEPYYDSNIQGLIADMKHEVFRDHHPVSLFTAIRFLDELAQLIKAKPVAEMPLEQAWQWEMRRVCDLVYETCCEGQLSRNKMIQGMSNRLQIILNDERRKYETK